MENIHEPVRHEEGGLEMPKPTETWENDHADTGVVRPKTHMENLPKDVNNHNHDEQRTVLTDNQTYNSAQMSNENTRTSMDASKIPDKSAIEIGSTSQNSETDCSNKVVYSQGTGPQISITEDGLRHRTITSVDESKTSQGEILDQSASTKVNDEETVDTEQETDESADADQENEDTFDASSIPYPGVNIKRNPDPELPDTVTTLTTPTGCKVYLVGTGHFSEISQEDVSKTIKATQPDTVMIELCPSRIGIFLMDEEKLLEEAKNINMDKILKTIKQFGVRQGIVNLLMYSVSAHITKQLGVVPGGEFRTAVKEAHQIPGCRVCLGDRPIQVTLGRAFGSLSMWQKFRVALALMSSLREPISKEDIEKFKQKDFLEEALRSMTGEFPTMSKVFVTERDLFLATKLRIEAKPIPNPNTETGTQPSVVVGVVGMGHVPGIVENWDKPADLRELMRIPPPSKASIVMKWTVRAVLLGTLFWGSFKLYRLCFPAVRDF